MASFNVNLDNSFLVFEYFYIFQVFNLLNADYPERWNKVKVIECQYEADELGISDKDKQLLSKETNIVINSSGVSHFKESLR